MYLTKSSAIIFVNIIFSTICLEISHQTITSSKFKSTCGKIIITSGNVDEYLTIHDGEEMFEELQSSIWNAQQNLTRLWNRVMDDRVYVNAELESEECFIQKCSQLFFQSSCADFVEQILQFSIYEGYPHWSVRCSCQKYYPEMTCWRESSTCSKFYQDARSDFENTTCAFLFSENHCDTCLHGYNLVRDGNTVESQRELRVLVVQQNCRMVSGNDSSPTSSLVAYEGVYNADSYLQLLLPRNWSCTCGDFPDDIRYKDWWHLEPENETISVEDGKGQGLAIVDSKQNSTSIVEVVLIIVSACAALIVCTICSILVYRKRKLVKDTELMELREIGNQEAKLRATQKFVSEYGDLVEYFDVIPDNNGEYRPCLKEREIDRGSFDIGVLLDSGRFASVYKGAWTNGSDESFAVKCVQKGGYYKRAIMYEMGILSSLEPHPNIVSFLGGCTWNVLTDELFLLLGFCENGSLKKFLATNRFVALVCNQEIYIPPSFDELNESILSTMHLLQWCIDIANGMIHLGLANIVHIDLAARNVLLTAQNVAKITDFGLSRVMINEPCYVKATVEPLPPDLAPESRLKRLFTNKSDVWSYGLTLWEIFTLGQEPLELENMQQAKAPSHTTISIFFKMTECWNLDPSKRPDFPELKNFFENCLALTKNSITVRSNRPSTSIPAFQKSSSGYVPNN